MAISDTTATDTAALLASILEPIDGLRVYAYVADTFRPPGVVIGLPRIDYADQSGGFCAAVYDHSLAVIVSRNSDRDAQRALAEWVARIVIALRDSTLTGAAGLEVLTAEPGSHNVNGQELPGYTVRVLVRA